MHKYIDDTTLSQVITNRIYHTLNAAYPHHVRAVLLPPKIHSFNTADSVSVARIKLLYGRNTAQDEIQMWTAENHMRININTRRPL